MPNKGDLVFITAEVVHGQFTCYIGKFGGEDIEGTGIPVYPCKKEDIEKLDIETKEYIMSNSQFICFHTTNIDSDTVREIKLLSTFNGDLKTYVEEETAKIINKAAQ